MRAANSERDPRCLLKIFQIFNIVVRNFFLGYIKLLQNFLNMFFLGNLAEDMFELVACYFPINYEPVISFII